jgi:hypothetical protein
MSVQRYVFRYKERPASYYEDIQARWVAAGHDGSRFDPQANADGWNRSFAGTHEKEGGGFTRELSEAKLIGWRSKRFMGRTDGDLIPATIII